LSAGRVPILVEQLSSAAIRWMSVHFSHFAGVWNWHAIAKADRGLHARAAELRVAIATGRNSDANQLIKISETSCGGRVSA
jgi:hypothetical protein